MISLKKVLTRHWLVAAPPAQNADRWAAEPNSNAYAAAKNSLDCNMKPWKLNRAQPRGSVQRPRRTPPRRVAARADPDAATLHLYTIILLNCRLRSSAAATLPFGENGGCKAQRRGTTRPAQAVVQRTRGRAGIPLRRARGQSPQAHALAIVTEWPRPGTE